MQPAAETSRDARRDEPPACEGVVDDRLLHTTNKAKRMDQHECGLESEVVRLARQKLCVERKEPDPAQREHAGGPGSRNAGGGEGDHDEHQRLQDGTGPERGAFERCVGRAIVEKGVERRDGLQPPAVRSGQMADAAGDGVVVAHLAQAPGVVVDHLRRLGNPFVTALRVQGHQQ